MPDEQPLSEHVAAEIRAEMARQRRKMSDLATELGVAPATVSDRMSGRYPFDIDELEKTARWLGVDIVQLLSPRRHSSAA